MPDKYHITREIELCKLRLSEYSDKVDYYGLRDIPAKFIRDNKTLRSWPRSGAGPKEGVTPVTIVHEALDEDGVGINCVYITTNLLRRGKELVIGRERDEGGHVTVKATLLTHTRT